MRVRCMPLLCRGLPKDETAPAPFDRAAPPHPKPCLPAAGPGGTLPDERPFYGLKPVRRVFEALNFYGVLIHVQGVRADRGRAILCETRDGADELLEGIPPGVTRAQRADGFGTDGFVG